jgi:3',5'-cyclic AMP phosphodiesterase CpdA
VALILHLTDLHLGGKPDDGLVDDYKAEIIPMAERISRRRLLQTTLAAISRSLEESGEKLDAVVVSGDITYQNDPTGFEALETVLGTLGKQLPAAEAVLVVPGNHDVTWSTPASTPERYKHFITYIRSHGYSTPLLDGIDIGVSSPGIPSRNLLLLDGGRVQIIPINSANYCGVIEPLGVDAEAQWASICKKLPSSEWDALSKSLHLLQINDAARISPDQFTALADMIASCPLPVRSPVTRVAVVHHQLLPVSTREEVKRYEAIINLGAFREFLLTNGFDLVLHGHKHTRKAYWENSTLMDPDEAHAKPMLVVSGSTVGGADTSRTEVCRLIRIDTQNTARCITVTSVPATDAGGKAKRSDATRYPIWDKTGVCHQSSDICKTISGGTLDIVYDKLLSYFVGKKELDVVHNLVCEVTNPAGAIALPINYPELSGRNDAARQQWLEELVKWWQLFQGGPRGREGFTHGQRIYRYEGNEDQFEEALRALEKQSNTSRAMINLVYPLQDRWDASKKAPSFCSLQLFITERNRTRHLNFVAYFRKQEMRYWWPVNFAELVLMHKQAVDRLSSSYRDITAGSIITFAASARVGEWLPKVAVPTVDRLLDEDENMLWQLAYGLVWHGLPAKEAVMAKWDELLQNLIPEDRADPDGAPIAIRGLTTLIGYVTRFMKVHGEKEVAAIHELLQSLLRANRSYADDTLELDKVPQARHDKWRAECIQIVGRLKPALQACWTVDKENKS